VISYDEILKQLSGAVEYGKYSAALCPFHDDHKPSLLVFRDGWFMCKGCGRHGNFDILLRGLSGWTPPDVIPEKTDWYGSNLPTDLVELEDVINEAHYMLTEHDDPLGWYLKDRGVFNRISPQWLGYRNGWYSIPIYSEDKEFCGVVMRAGKHIQETTGQRFTMPHGQGTLLYIPDYGLVRESDYLVVVYGMFDALALCELRIPVCTDTTGKGGLHARMLDEFRKPIIVLPDEGEEDTGRKLVGSLGWRGKLLDLDYPDGCKDPADCLKNGYSEWLISQIWRKK